MFLARKKNQFLTVAGLLAIAATSSSYAATGPTADQGEALSAQVQVTRDALQQVMAKLRASGEQLDDGMAHPDFLAKSRIFGDRVNQAMATFETTMHEQVLKPASVWVERMKKIQASPAYTYDQKVTILKDQYTQAQSQFADLSKLYQYALGQLYRTVMPSLNFKYLGANVSTKFCSDANVFKKVFNAIAWGDNTFKRCTTEIEFRFRLSVEEKNGYEAADFGEVVLKSADLAPSMLRFKDPARNRRYSDPSIWELGDEDADATGESIHPYDVDPKYFPQLSKWIYERHLSFGCYSGSCLPLYGSQLTSFISLVRSTLDKNITFATSEGKLTLTAINGDTKHVLGYLRTDLGVVRSLPFEISDADNRAATIAQLTSVVLDTNVDFDRCPSDTKKLTELLCRAEEVPGRGCLSTAEKSDLASQIEKLSIQDKAKRQRKACLETPSN